MEELAQLIRNPRANFLLIVGIKLSRSGFVTFSTRSLEKMLTTSIALAEDVADSFIMDE